MLKSEALVKAEAYKFLANNHVAVLATSFGKQPIASTVYYIIDENFNFYILTKRGTEKYKNIALNSSVALVVGFGPTHINVRATGKASFLYNKEKAKAIERIKHLAADKQINKHPLYHLSKFTDAKGMIVRSEVIVKIKPERLFFFNLDDKKYKKAMSGKDVQII